jgi:hypothetical protein
MEKKTLELTIPPNTNVDSHGDVAWQLAADPPHSSVDLVLMSNMVFLALTFQCPYKQGVCRDCGLAIYIKKYLKAKQELWKHSNISPCKNIIFKTIF